MWPTNQLDWSRVDLQKALSLMHKADALSKRARRSSRAGTPLDSWDTFRTRSIDWAQSLGFDVDTDVVSTCGTRAF